MGVIAFLTDFGLDDWYVGSMKGVALGINPDARLVDITHHIPAGDVFAGAFALNSSYRSFAPSTVFVVVVDPTVGSPRRALVAQLGDYFFIGPDNGVLSLVFRGAKDLRIHEIENRKFALPEMSATFHGRDLFTPVAAHLSRDTACSIQSFGKPVDDFYKLSWPEPTIQDNRIVGQVIYIDGFGNLITSIDRDILDRLSPKTRLSNCGKSQRIPIRAYYQEVVEGTPVGLVGSSGFLEISINRGNAAKELGAGVGDPVEVLSDPTI